MISSNHSFRPGLFNQLYFDCLLRPERLSQPSPRVISRQSWCIDPDSVVFSNGREKVSAPENLIKKVLSYTFYQKCAKEWNSKVFFRTAELQYKIPPSIDHSKKIIYFTTAKKHVFIYSLSV